MKALLALLCFTALAPGLAQAQGPHPVKVKVVQIVKKQPCKCEGDDGVKPSKVISEKCFLATDINPLEPVEPFSKMFLLMNQVKAKKTLVQVPDSHDCKFKKGKMVRLWSTDTDPGFLEITPRCGREHPGYADSCEPYGRFITLYRTEQLGAR